MILSVSGVVKAMWQDYLRLHDFLGPEAEGRRLRVARLLLEGLPANRPPVQPRRRAGLQPASAQPQRSQSLAQQNAGRLSASPRRILLLAAVNQPIQKRAGGDNCGPSHHLRPSRSLSPKTLLSPLVPSPSSITRSTTSACRICNPGWLSSTSRILTRYSCLSHCALGLHTAGPRELFSSRNWIPHRVGHLAHNAAQRVHLAHQVPLGHAADRRIAAHLRNQVQVHGDQRGLEPHARRGHRRLAPGVPRAHHHHIVFFGEMPSKAILRTPPTRQLAIPRVAGLTRCL
jgi:hypothetical protein